MFAVGAVAEIAMYRENGFCERFQMLGSYESNHICHARKSCCVVMRHPEAAARQEIVAFQLAVFGDGNKSQVVRKNVDVVQRWNREGGLEFPGQVRLAVQWINKAGMSRAIQIERLPLQPDAM